MKRHPQLGLYLGLSAIEVPKDRKEEEISEGIPVTYVPARNIIFLSQAVAQAEVRGLACGHCDACILRLKGFAEAGMKDPAGYAE